MATPTIHAVRKTFNASLWLGLLGSGTIWAIHLQLLYSLVKAAQRTHSYGLLYATTAVCFALVAGFGLLSWRDLGQVRQGDAATDSSDPAGRTRFLAILGISASALFGLTILATGVATHFFDANWE
jgi:hypothetical protein